eukprot:147582-Prorocentrum_minimum.AAC.1
MEVKNIKAASNTQFTPLQVLTKATCMFGISRPRKTVCPNQNQGEQRRYVRGKGAYFSPKRFPKSSSHERFTGDTGESRTKALVRDLQISDPSSRSRDHSHLIHMLMTT